MSGRINKRVKDTTITKRERNGSKKKYSKSGTKNIKMTKQGNQRFVQGRIVRVDVQETDQDFPIKAYDSHKSRAGKAYISTIWTTKEQEEMLERCARDSMSTAAKLTW